MRLYLRLSMIGSLSLLLFCFFCFSPSLVQGADSPPVLPVAPAGSQAVSFKQLAAGSHHTCGLTAAGGVKCWGANWFGQLGDGGWLEQSIPVDVAGLDAGVTAISANNGYMTCALLADATVRCWGANFEGQLGNGETVHSHIPVAVVGLTNVTAIGGGESHMCAVVSGGALRCWGDNYAGQLGDGTTSLHSTPAAVQGLGGPVVHVAGGRSHTCAILQSGTVQCWGDNSGGQLGNGKRGVNSYTPVNVVGLAGVALQLAGEYNSTCALLQSSAVACWGWVNDQVAKPAAGLESGMSSITMGSIANYCATTTAGAAVCAGMVNEAGQLGNGTTEFAYMPQLVAGVTSGATQVVLGYRHGCALVKGQALCWGSNGYGQLGIGQSQKRTIPATTAGGPWAQVSAGSLHTCGITVGGAALCWGESYDGQLGNNTGTYSSTPSAVSGLGAGVKQVSAGSAHSCAVMDGGGVKCWGHNYYGQLGKVTENSWIATPVVVTGLSSGVKAVAAGGYFTCALTDAGAVKCWGINSSGELGNGAAAADSHVPVDVSGLQSGVTAISAGHSHACALLTDGRVYCWGGNYAGEIGDGTTDTDRFTPVQVQSLEPAVAVSAGDYMTCALLATGGVKCWGALDMENSDGQPLPVAITGLTNNIQAISAGNSYACALSNAGAVRCFGLNRNGELGNGTTADTHEATSDVIGLAAGAAAIDAGSSHACALLATGSLRCWGQDGDGQLGSGRAARYYTPMPVADTLRQELFLNHNQGQPGSQFTLTGFGFAPGGSVRLNANGTALGDPLPVNAGGSFITVLDSSAADEGYYLITAEPVLSLAAAQVVSAVTLVINNGAPLQPEEGGGAATLSVPAGIAVDVESVYLPLQMK